MINENDLIPYSTSALPPGPWLVFAPHPDDETFGMGGSLLLASELGIETSVVILTDGGLGGDDEAIADIRLNEAKRAIKALGVKGRYFWKLPDRGLEVTDALIAKVARLIAKVQPLSVFFPTPMELHPDHRQTAVLVWEGLRQASTFTGKAFSYEISTQGQINYLIDISAVVDKKNQVMALYASQQAISNYTRIVQSLDCARTYTLPKSVQAAEGFWQYEDLSKSLASFTLGNLRPYWQSAGRDKPVPVSIIVRTQNRPVLLAEALQSICEQTYPNIEVIVVNDGGADVSGLVEGFMPNVAALRLIQLPVSIGRSGAANQGLKQARGVWITFLDDDDLLEPLHIQQLMKATLLGDARVVYSGTQVLQVGQDGGSHEVAEYNVPYSSERLLYENFIPIHSALFHRGLIDDGISFDTCFDFFEDWDFWLQISQKTIFLHSPSVTAIYRLHANASGVHQSDNKALPYLQIYSKWLANYPIEKSFSLLQKSHQWFEEKITGLQQAHSKKLDEIGQQHSYAHHIVQERDAQLADLTQALEAMGQQHSYSLHIVQERDAQLASLTQALASIGQQHSYALHIVQERDGQLADLKQAVETIGQQHSYALHIVEERDGQLADLKQAVETIGQQHSYALHIVEERDGQLADLKQAVETIGQQLNDAQHLVQEYDGQLASLNQALAERDGQLASLNQALAERDGQLASLNQALAERDAYIGKLISSNSWFITKPIRWLSRLVRGDFVAALDPLTKRFNLKASPALSPPITAPKDMPDRGDSWVTVAPIKPTHPVAVILPVYRNVAMTKGCILAAMPGLLAVPGARLIAINDDSPDQGMQEMLEQLAALWPEVFVVLRNGKNRGFVGTVNRGFAYFPHHDAVLLNSDVIVPKDWLGRLIDEAYSRANIGTVTPFSNNATLCSFPYFLQENPQPFGLDVDVIDAVFRQVKLPCVEAPTGVGFCMYIRRACLDEVGVLNEEKFGRGYGEENDLCQRALKAGWLNIISPNIYAFHEGGISFSSAKQALVDNAMRVIDGMHPNYHADIQVFINNDPVKSVRVARYVQLLPTLPIPKVLHVSHALGGGVAQHIDELAQHLGLGIAHLLLTPQGGEDAVSISLGIDPYADKLLFAIPSGYTDLLELLSAIGLSAIHFHHTQGLDPMLLRLPSDLGVPHLLTVHDYYWLNGNPTLTDKQGKYPGFYSDTLHNPLYPLPQDLTPVAWRAQLQPLLENAKCVIFPSNATQTLFGTFYQLEKTVVAPHIEAQLAVGRTPRAFIKKDAYLIGVLGAIGREKGADLLEELAGLAKSVHSPLKFKLLGYAYRPLKGVETTGPYKTKELASLIQTHQLDMVFFSALWPETYSYTLSYALDSGLPIIAPNIGAFPERLSGRANTLLFNHLDPVHELLKQIEAFIGQLAKGERVTAAIFANAPSHPDFYEADYNQLLSRNLKVIASDKTVPFKFHPAHIVSGATEVGSTWREALLRVLWSLYMKPSMRWISHALPYALRRRVKRSLSRSAIHDITR